MQKLEFRRANILRGALVYAAGDGGAALILGEFSWWRLLGIALIGATVYAFEVPNYFNWIEAKMQGKSSAGSSLLKTGLAMLYFNPLWVARHMFFIRLFSGQADETGWGLLCTAIYSFTANIPISVAGNFVIQNMVGLRWRFLASAVFSALMALYYALSIRWFE